MSLGSYRPRSVDTDGFIHLSQPDQVLKVANEFYSGVDDLILLGIDPHKLICELRWEMAEGDTFPHLYGSLNLDAVTSINKFLPDEDGVFRKLPKEYT